VSLPPVAKHTEMMVARINQEQAIEGLRLNFVAARRDQQRAARAEAAAQRTDLQMRSLQPCVVQQRLMASRRLGESVESQVA